MIKRRLNFNRRLSESSEATTTTPREEEIEWEMRPGGMLVQKRTDNSDSQAPNLRIRVAHGTIRYEISVSSQSTFGEMKKLLTAESGLEPGDQRLIFRGKERENGEYLDMSGVKDRSKVILIEDPSSRERRIIEMRRNAKIQTAHRQINDISTEVDKLAEQHYWALRPWNVGGPVYGVRDSGLSNMLARNKSSVVRTTYQIASGPLDFLVCRLVSAIEKSIANGNKVPEVQITTLIEMLMRQAVKLDTISTEGDACATKNLQGKRVQKCVEALDAIKVSNARIKPVIVTTKWETFDPPPLLPPSTTTHWEFFD
ncbi:unnamed protein product [Camellia sinensis]